jgi:hypothetical protein
VWAAALGGAVVVVRRAVLLDELVTVATSSASTQFGVERLVLFLACTGLRAAELAGLEVGDVDLTNYGAPAADACLSGMSRTHRRAGSHVLATSHPLLLTRPRGVWVPRTVSRLLTSAFVVAQARRPPAIADQHDRSLWPSDSPCGLPETAPSSPRSLSA